ncbi:NADPH-dependent 7-cyano-7-deazaguanine reductase QueF [Rhodoferax sp.]|uniref:NADPH-dependent 7-cyano-7-deazaguanine reductase QueF n=1 Tax=Rhodoferax sp. TaxID=50421 RepID=UPI0019F205D0|nr:NADPH-dependent 7-cyano-7-deazaguanine reductase QueF [Rhodoferax sp.]MBE0473746.1 NADPH-dependent 7-cyano-7-deazaguanine reductase QueF [Rhodoferax sp.]
MLSSAHSPLGKPSRYADQYDPALLFPIARAPQRGELGIGTTLPFLGADLWTAFELSWLNARGKPQVALAHIMVPCESVNLIESKSLKLYLGSFNNSRFADAAEVASRLRTDLTEAAWRGAMMQSSVGVKLVTAELFDREPIQELDGLSLDRLDLDCDRYAPAPELLTSCTDEAPVSEVLTSNLLRSNCPVTGQPDWGSVQISYFGPQIEQAGLLRYIVSFRKHQGFHEHCVERMFMDIMVRCQPHKLTVYARYTRRGGLDINPFRTSHPQSLPTNHRNARQ